MVPALSKPACATMVMLPALAEPVVAALLVLRLTDGRKTDPPVGETVPVITLIPAIPSSILYPAMIVRLPPTDCGLDRSIVLKPLGAMMLPDANNATLCPWNLTVLGSNRSPEALTRVIAP